MSKDVIENVVESMNKLQLDIAALSECYYHQDCSPEPDFIYDQMVRDLLKLKSKNLDEFEETKYFEEYADFDGSTGCHLSGLMSKYKEFHDRVDDYKKINEQQGG